MRSGIVIGLLGFGRRGLRAGNCSRSFSQSSSASLGQAAGHEAATAAAPAATAPKQLSGLPHGRRYLPAAVSAQLGAQALLPGAAASVMGLQRQGCVSITVQCSPDAAGTQILVINGAANTSSTGSSSGSSSSAKASAALTSTAHAAAAGTWPTLPAWLFGFACGSAAASAMAYSYLKPQPAAAAEPSRQGLAHRYPALAAATNSSSSSSQMFNSRLTDISFPGSVKPTIPEESSSSSNSSNSSNSGWGGILLGSISWGLGCLQQLGRLGAASAHAAATPYPDSRLLPTPWEQQEASSSSSSSSAGPAAAAGSSDGDAVLMRSSISAAAAAAGPAVVHLVAAGAASGPAAAGGLGPGYLDGRAQGSGFIYDPRGFILTNAHVVLGTPPAAAMAASTANTRWPQHMQANTALPARAESSSSSSIISPAAAGGLLVHLADGRVFEGRVVALDRASDLAVVAVEAPEPLPCARLGNSHRLRVGEWVVALGSPFLLRQSVTAGIVSCVERKGSELGLSSPRTEFIQTDAAINVGNSGGPLVNLDGEVVGMNNMKAAQADGVSFAIPINTIKSLLSEISRHGRVLRPYVGITMAEVKPSRMAQLRTACPDFPADVAAGIVVTRVAPGSPAAAAGLKEDDVIVAAAAAGAAPGQLVPTGLSVAALADALRDAIGGSLDLVVVREQRQQQQQGAAGAVQGGAGSSRYVYVTVTVRPVEAASG